MSDFADIPISEKLEVVGRDLAVLAGKARSTGFNETAEELLRLSMKVAEVRNDYDLIKILNWRSPNVEDIGNS